MNWHFISFINSISPSFPLFHFYWHTIQKSHQIKGEIAVIQQYVRYKFSLNYSYWVWHERGGEDAKNSHDVTNDGSELFIFLTIIMLLNIISLYLHLKRCRSVKIPLKRVLNDWSLAHRFFWHLKSSEKFFNS